MAPLDKANTAVAADTVPSTKSTVVVAASYQSGIPDKANDVHADDIHPTVSSHATKVIGSEVVGSAKSTKTFRNPQRYRPGPIEGLPIREIRRAKEAQARRAHKAFKLKSNIRRNKRGPPSPDFLEINFPETWSMMKRINKPSGIISAYFYSTI